MSLSAGIGLTDKGHIARTGHIIADGTGIGTGREIECRWSDLRVERERQVGGSRTSTGAIGDAKMDAMRAVHAAVQRQYRREFEVARGVESDADKLRGMSTAASTAAIAERSSVASALRRRVLIRH